MLPCRLWVLRQRWFGHDTDQQAADPKQNRSVPAVHERFVMQLFQGMNQRDRAENRTKTSR